MISLKPGICFVGMFLFLTAFPTFAAGTPTLKVVAAENTYGDLVQQIGGSRVRVLNVLSDPNVDPHEYESDVTVAKQVADADLIVENGGGYDDWMDKLLKANKSPKRTVVRAFDLASVRLKENEHVWYNPTNILILSQRILGVLKDKDPAGAKDFDTNYLSLKAELQNISHRLSALKARYARTPVALTETIFLYQTELMGLAVLTPWTFEKAVAEGSEPAPTDTITAEKQLTTRQVKVLIFNIQTITPITTRLQIKAKALGIPVVAVSETMPTGDHYQTWMMGQLDTLETALARK